MKGVDSKRLVEYDLLAFFCPTYGDEELQDDFETFLIRFDLDLTGKHFVICKKTDNNMEKKRMTCKN